MTAQAETRMGSPKPKFAHDVLKMASAPAFTQVVGILVIPLITRLYAPEAFGLLALFGSICAPLQAFTTMGYSTSIMLPESDEEGATMFGASLLFAVLVGGLTSLLIVFGQDIITGWLKTPALKSYLWLVPISIFVSGLYMSLRYWNMRNKRFGHIATGQIGRYISNNGFVLGAGFLGHPTAPSLIFGEIGGSIANAVVLSRRVFREHGKLLKRSIRWPRIIAGVKRYRKFPKYVIWVELISRFSGQIPIYLLSYYFSQSIIGYYSLGLRLLKMPLSLIANSIGEVYFQRVSKNKYEKDLLLDKLFERLVLFGLLPFSLLGLIGAELFTFALGSKWTEAGVYAQILSFQMFIQFITGPAGYLMLILEKQEVSLFLRFAEMFVSVIAISLGGLCESIYVSFILLSFLSGLLYAGYGFYFMTLRGIRLSMMFRTLGKYLLLSAPLLIVIMFGKWYFHFSERLIILVGILGAIIFYSLALKRDQEIRSFASGILRKIMALGR